MLMVTHTKRYNAYKMVAPSLLNLLPPGPFQSFGDRFCFQLSSNPPPPGWGRGSGCLSSSGFLSPSLQQNRKLQFRGNVRNHDFSCKRSHGCYTGSSLELAEISFSPAAAPGPLLILGELTRLLDGTQSEAEPELTNARRDGASWARPG